MAANIDEQSKKLSPKTGKLRDMIFGNQNEDEKNQLPQQQEDHTVIISEEPKIHDNKLQPSDSEEWQEFDIVKVTPTSSPEMNSSGEGVVVDEQEDDAKVSEEDAICKLCFVVLTPGNTIMQTNCKCKKALVHEECSGNVPSESKGIMCVVCGQENKHVRVTLQRRGTDAAKKRNKHNRILRLFRRP